MIVLLKHFFRLKSMFINEYLRLTNVDESEGKYIACGLKFGLPFNHPSTV